MTDEMAVYENRQRLYLKQCRKAYRDWIESKALFDSYHRIKTQGVLAINYHAIKKSREKREMDEVE